MPRFVVLHGPDAGRRFELADGIAVVGRHSTNPVPLTDPRVSRRHCEVRVIGSRVQLADLGSGNGTGVNGSPVQTVDLRTGDRIQIGDTLLEFFADSSTQSAATRPEPEGARVVVRPEHPSAILRSVPAGAGGQLLARPDLAESDWLRSRLANLAVLYEASNAISEILDVDQLLERIVDLVRTATDADHGCALLLDRDTGELVPKAVRSKHRTGGEIVVSRTVADHVLKEKHGVLVGDAAADERFRGGASVARHRLREVICVPMAGRRETVGVLFLDTSTAADDTAVVPGRPGKFTEDHLRLAVAVGHQAALAVEESRYYRALIQAERLAAVGQTIAGLSHHIKNVMQGVRFGGDMVRMALTDGDQGLLAKGWKLVEKSQGRIDDLILDMLNFAKEREPSSEPTDLNSVAAEAVETVRGRASDSRVAITFVPGDGLPPVPCDPDGVLRAILNVVSNAVDAAGTTGGTVTVTVGQADGSAEVRVADTGPGIPANRLDDIFKPFVSTKGSKGTGLGLPAARKTLHEHGGDVTAANAPGGGAVFTLRLPLTAAARPPGSSP